ncbi:PHA/PHB synthase family protein [Variovorax sp. JS1663]|uniref:PHA/PHB synthase family protein n=1 Tax=Variovorax sp. JS1663 TaxID=1851577 RepID=UPI000B3428CB|nr:alpha/beta fold hydrolase [Variovorax sp. JS1663]OUM00907.1 poly-beta-hydroxybutyrate polymerase [Variovorax sp. JS1663]
MSLPIDELDRTFHAAIAQWTRGLSPAALMLAWSDWAVHMAAQPVRSAEVTVAGLLRPPPHGPTTPDPTELDRRLAHPAWARWPFSMYRDAFRDVEQFVRNLTSDVPGVERHHGEIVSFAARQLLGMCSPANFCATNPVVSERTRSTWGWNLVRGALEWSEDFRRVVSDQPPQGVEAFVPGKDVACSPGKVVLRTRLMELIQYEPTTATVHPEPILVMSAWIMKYYILDLSPDNSLIRYLVGQGHTVFAISWKNPDAADADLGIEDYLRLGLMASLEAIHAIVPRRRIHALGYCLGGTLLAIGAAALARDGDDRLATLTLLAAQTDFTEPGELGLFIDQSQLSFLEDLMARQGYLNAWQMAGAFHLLRAMDLIWTPWVQNYLLGERAPMTDLMAWNADGTRMPYRMHADYLRRLFLENDLAEGRFPVDGRPVSLGDLRLPIFAVGTRTDHVAPWRSVYKLNLLCNTDIRFVLTEGGHNAGIVSEPGHHGRSYRIHDRRHDHPYVPPDTYVAQAMRVEGSWWPALDEWLSTHSSARVKPPAMGHAKAGYLPLCDAPGQYVAMR